MAFHDPRFAKAANTLWQQESARSAAGSRGVAYRRLLRRMPGVDPVEWTGDDPALVAAQEAYRTAHARWVAQVDDL